MLYFTETYGDYLANQPKQEDSCKKVVTRPLMWGEGPTVAQGLQRSLSLRAIVAITLLVGGAILGNKFGDIPKYWIGVAAGVSIVGIGILAKKSGRVQFELGAIKRLGNNLLGYNNYDEIPLKTKHTENQGQLYLGASPNRLAGEAEHLANDKKIGFLFTFLARWELHVANGSQVPYTDADIRELEIIREHFVVEDHAPLTPLQLDEAADCIYSQLCLGTNVYVHCKAGNGRSAQAIAAYLMKYERMPVQEAIDWIKKNRPSSTIEKKRDALNAYYTVLSKLFRNDIQECSNADDA